MLSHKLQGSFRDPKGHIYIKNGDIYRTITSSGIDDYEAVRNLGFYDELIESNQIVSLEEVDENIELGTTNKDIIKVLKHPKISFISYPYEWSFSALKDAALLHLDIQIKALKKDIVTSDSSAYNIQFKGPIPIFIDHLSFRPYCEGEYWLAHSQFCEQFINPLLFQAYNGISFHSWYRGSLEGISSSDLYRILPWKAYLSLSIITNIILPGYLEQKSSRNSNKAVSKKINKHKLPKASYKNMLMSLHSFISKLEPKNRSKTVWEDYEKNNIYNGSEVVRKRDFVSEFVKRNKPEILWDIGCNTGDYSQLALNSGAKKVIGFEYDLGALELSYKRAKINNLDFLPLYLDLANPTPSQGWNQNERIGLFERRNADALIALAIIHHLCIGRNIPLEEVVKWLISIAPVGVIEFVPKSDPMVKELLELREDIFDSYSEDVFIDSLSKYTNIIKSDVVTKSGRTMFWYERTE